jgi:hypothetical protein
MPEAGAPVRVDRSVGSGVLELVLSRVVVLMAKS